MTRSIAEQLIEMRNQADNNDRKLTVSLDPETASIVKRWNVGNARETVKWLCKVADEALARVSNTDKGLND